MIIRIFRATVPAEHHLEFEKKFKEISVPLVKNHIGLISVEIAGPTQWNPNEFVLISRWESEKDIAALTGKNLDQAHIPKGMEAYIEKKNVPYLILIKSEDPRPGHLFFYSATVVYFTRPCLTGGHPGNVFYPSAVDLVWS